MKYFPDPGELTEPELRELYRLRRFDEWRSFLKVVELCSGKISQQIEDESLKGQANVVFRHIGARAYTGELQEFLEAADQHLNLLSAGGTQDEKTF